MVIAAFLTALVVASSPASPGWAVDEPVGERITGYAVDLQVEDDGRLLVHESLVYDYGSTPSAGFLRTLRLRSPYDWDVDRVMVVSDLEVGSKTAPADVVTREGGGALRIWVGDEDEPVAGKHRYDITYTVRGAVQDFGSHIELIWEAIGTDWQVPIVGAAVELSGVPVQSASCYYGSNGSRLPCETVDTNSGEGLTEFGHPGLPREQGLTIVAALPPSYVDVPNPILIDSAGGTDDSPGTTTAALAAAAIGGVAVGIGIGWLLWVRRRPRPGARTPLRSNRHRWSSADPMRRSSTRGSIDESGAVQVALPGNAVEGAPVPAYDGLTTA